MKQSLTKKQLKAVEDALPKLRRELNIVRDGSITLPELIRIHGWVWNHFSYKPDSYTFNAEDYWDINVFDRMVLSWINNTDKEEDDCDGFGYSVIEAIYRLKGISKDRLRAVACAAETGEGHFVAWVKLDSGNWYQTENRTFQPKPIQHFVDLGYDYWYYSPLDKVGSWFNISNDHLGEIGVLASPQVTLSSYTAVTKSKTLIKEWVTKLAGIATILASQVPTWRTDLEHILTPTHIGYLMVASGIIGIILRIKTTKPIDRKRGLDR